MNVVPAAKVLVRYPRDMSKLLLVKRHVNGTCYYKPAGGKVEVSHHCKTAETLEMCAMREAREELGVSISINCYLGSYYFFWTIDPRTCSSCAVFLADIADYDAHFISNADTGELTIEPAWVACHDIMDGAISFDPMYVGLHNIVHLYCKQEA